MSKEKKDEVPVRIISEDEEIWTAVRDEAKALMDNHKKSMIVQKGMHDLAIQKLSEIEKNK